MSYKNNYSPYSKKLCHKAIRFVFDTVYFSDPHLRQVLLDSYFLNIGIMRQYARDNHIDEIGYLLSIRDTLLKIRGVYGR